MRACVYDNESWHIRALMHIHSLMGWDYGIMRLFIDNSFKHSLNFRHCNHDSHAETQDTRFIVLVYHPWDLVQCSSSKSRCRIQKRSSDVIYMSIVTCTLHFSTHDQPICRHSRFCNNSTRDDTDKTSLVKMMKNHFDTRSTMK